MPAESVDDASRALAMIDETIRLRITRPEP